MSSSIPLNDLREHVEFARRLAHGLLGHAHDAEDVAQETALLAMQKPPRRGAGAWTGRVARRLALRVARGERRRRRRERQAASPEVAAEPGARELVLAEVTRAVLALPELYRTTVLLRFYENVPVAAIAERHGVSVATVQSRLRRGLERLRSELDRRVPGGRVAWSAVVLPWSPAKSVASGGALAIAGVSGLGTVGGIMTTSVGVKAAVTAMVLAGAGLAWWWGSGAPEPVGPGQVPVVEGPADPMRAGGGDTRDATGRVPVPEAVAELPEAEAPERHAPPAGRAGLRLIVTWERDGTPASGRAFDVVSWRDPQPLRMARWVRTDEAGIAVVDDLAPGRVGIYGDIAGGASTTLEAGEVAELEIEIPIGVAVRGRVVGTGEQPVAGATVWVSEYGVDDEGHVVATTDARGEFSLRGVEPRRRLAAWAPGWSPAGLTMLPGAAGDEVEVILRLGAEAAELRGEVVDELGQPIAGAELRVQPGVENQLGDQLWPTRDAISDERGRFRMSGLRRGDAQLMVRHPGRAVFTMSLVLAAANDLVRVCLPPTPELRGVVRTARGEPVAEVSVSVGTYAGFTSAFTNTADDGAFALDGLPVGEVVVTVEKAGFGSATSEVVLRGGETTEWNPVLLAGRTYAAQVVDELGQSHAGWSVFAVSDQTRPNSNVLWSQSATTDDNGRFRITGCPDSALRVELHPPGVAFAVAKHRAQRFDGVEERIEVASDALPTASLVGRLVDHRGEPVGGRLSLAPLAGRCEVSAADGRFELDGLVPGEYSLWLSGPGVASQCVAAATARARSEVDLGTLTVAEPGWLRLTAGGQQGCAPFGQMWLRRRGEGKSRPVSVDASTEWPLPLLPGRYEYGATGDELVTVRGELEIGAGRESDLDLPVRRGVPCHIAVRGADGTELAIFLSFALLDADGRQVDRWVARGGGAEASTTRWPAPGRYTLQVREQFPRKPPNVGREGEVELTVGRGGSVRVAVMLR